MIATEPALIVTIITEPTHAIHLIRHLARLQVDGGFGLQQVKPDVWYNEKEKTIAEWVTHPDLTDVEIVQVALNMAQTVREGWLAATKKLQEALTRLPEQTEKAILGRTLIRCFCEQPVVSMSILA